MSTAALPDAKSFQKRFQDQLDAGQLVTQWFMRIIKNKHMAARPGSRITVHNLVSDGCVHTLWKDEVPLAHAVIIRDQWNYSVVTCVEV